MIDRSRVCQMILDAGCGDAYLEIGVNEGKTFHAIKAVHKTAVDPNFLFDVDQRRHDGENTLYFEVTSDEYFASTGRSAKFDVIYLDGLHTLEQTLRDLLNSTEVLKEGGVIIIDDVRPTSYAASLKSMPAANYIKSLTGDQDPAWMGDVYKLVWFIDSFMQQYSFATVAENHGQLVMWRKTRKASAITERLLSSIGLLTFEEMANNMSVFNVQGIKTIVEQIESDRNEQS